VSNSYRGIWIVSSLETEIIGNEIFDTKRGVLIEGSITKTRVSNNTIRDNELGIYVMLGFNTLINRNNFIDNQLEATFSSFGFILGRINWNNNYWGKVLHHPKFILGTVFILPWIQIDWRPAQEPYDFGGLA
jgi:parallel beta-helix repeat protein